MKDPAFLFYYRDFKSATENMTNAQRGAYIQLMCIQAENGYICEKDMKKICSNICFDTMTVLFDEDTYNVVKIKFREIEDRPGCFINDRLATEIENRIRYSESRRKNRTKNISKTYDNTYDEDCLQHMVNVNVNGNINENRKGVQGENKTDLPLKNSKISKTSSPTTGPTSDGQPQAIDPSELIDPVAEMIQIVPMLQGSSLTEDFFISDVWPAFVAKSEQEGEYRTRRQHFGRLRNYIYNWAKNIRSNQSSTNLITKKSKKYEYT